MPHIHTLTRTLVTAAAIVALTAPAALARPADLHSPPAGDASALPKHVQELRWLNARNSIQASSLAGTTSDTPADGKGAVYWSYDYAAPKPQGARAVNPDDDTPWATIAVGLAGAALLLGGAAAITGRVRLRSRRARVAA